MSQPEARRHGRRLRALGDAFHRSVKYSLRPLDWQQFAEQFAALPEPVVRELYVGLYKEGLHRMRMNIEAEFAELCEEHGLREKLAALEELCEAQGVADGDAAEAARQPALGPTNAIRLGLLRAKQAEAEQLRGVLAQVQTANGELGQQLEERRQRVQELLAKGQPIASQLEEVHASSRAWSNRVVEAAS